MIFFCIHMLVAVGNDTEHIPNTNTNDDHCPSEAHCDPSPRHSSPASVASFFSRFFVEIDERHLPSPFPAVLNDTTCQNPDVLCVHAARIWPNA